MITCIHKSSTILRIMVLPLLLVLVACESLQAAPDVTGQQKGVLHYQQHNRNYILYTPVTYSATKPTPLIVVLHGGHGDAKKAFERTDFYRLADREGFIVVYPEAVASYWNDGRNTTASEVDDVAYISALVDHIGRQRNVDSERIYVTGLSNGGMMTQRLACESSQKFAAFASVIANIPVSLQAVCHPKNPVAFMMINGSADPLMPPSGGEIKKSRFMGVGGTVLSTQQTVKFWAEVNHCDDNRTVTKLPDRDPADGTRIERIQYTGCRQNGEVVLYNIEGGGHAWPGSKPRPFLQRFTGKTSNDMKASEAIWDFFKKHFK